MKIHCYKIRKNIKGNITHSRFLVDFNHCFYYIKCGFYQAKSFAPFDQYVVTPLDKILLSTPAEIDDYISQNIKGTHENSLFDQGRCTSDNIKWKRIELFLEYILNFDKRPEEVTDDDLKTIQTYHTIDVTDIQTESEFNFTDCSGDTIADGESEMLSRFYTDLELDFDTSEYQSEEQIWDLEKEYNTVINRDVIDYHKAVKKIDKLTKLYAQQFPVLPIAHLDNIIFSYLIGYTVPQLLQLRREYWKASDFYTSLIPLIQDDRKI